MNSLIGTGFGVLAVVLGGCCALFATLPGTARRDTTRLLLAGCAASALASTLVLGWALLTSDFTMTYVVDQSRREASAPIRLAGLWGGIEGSLLLWGTMAAVIGAATSTRLRSESDRVATTVRGLLGGIAGSTIAITLLLTNPFRRLQIPAISGAGLAPILEHPAMTFHPPLLYLGVLSFAPPFALAVGRLATRTFDADAARRVARWTVLALALTTVGLLSGANWAYVELGWGGYWAWDPVENAAFLPWLVGLAFVHSARGVREGADGDRQAPVSKLVALLAVAPFLAMSFGAAVVRSGFTTSVHSFAEQLSVGWAMGAVTAALLVVTAGAIFTQFRATQAHATAHGGATGGRSLIGLERIGIRIGTVLITLFALTVAVGTFAPLLMAKGTLVSGHFYAPVAGPLAGVAVILTGLVPLARGGVGRRAALALAGAGFGAGIALGIGWPLGRAGLLLAAAGAGLAGAAPTMARLARRSPGAAIGHLGFALLVIGVAGSTAGADLTTPLLAGQSVTVDDFTLTNDGVAVREGPVQQSTTVVADIRVERDGELIDTLHPELVAYAAKGRLLAEIDTRSTMGGDLQIALERASNDQTVIIDIHTRPLIRLVWLGPLLMTGGFLMAARPRRTRVATAHTDASDTGTVAPWNRPETATSPSTGADPSPPPLPIPS